MDLVWVERPAKGMHLLIDSTDPVTPNKADLALNRVGVPVRLFIWSDSGLGWVGCADRCPCTGEEEVKEWAKRTYLMEFAQR